MVANHKLIEVIRTTNRAFALSNEEMMAAGAAQPMTPDSVATAEETAREKPAPADADAGVEDEKEAQAGDDAAPPPAPEKAQLAKADAPSVFGESTMGEEMIYTITAGRKKLTQLIFERASAEVAKLGIELRDVQFKRIDYVESVQTKVFDRMVSERRRVAEAFRSQGQGMSAEILGKKDRDLKTIRSEAYRQAQEIRGRADGEAAALYAEAYKADPGFYRFVKTLESYEITVDENTWLLLSTDADYARQMTTMKGD